VPWINDVRAGRLGTRKQRKAWVRAWTVILRRDCSPQWLLRDPDEGQSSEYHDVWNSPATMLFDDIVAVMTEQLARTDHGIAPTDQSGRDWGRKATPGLCSTPGWPSFSTCRTQRAPPCTPSSTCSSPKPAGS
jgi:hypothetical protein